MLKLPIEKQRVTGPALLVLMSLVLYLFDPESYQLLAFYRTGISEFEWWRLVSANLIHTNFNHVLLNAAGITLLWALHGYYYQTFRYLTIFLLCSLGTTIGIFYFNPSLIWYAGLSGALHGIFVWGAYRDIREGLKTGWVLMLGLWVKIAYEQFSGPSAEISALIDATVAIEAHLYGAITGTLLVIGLYIVNLINTKKAR